MSRFCVYHQLRGSLDLTETAASTGSGVRSKASTGYDGLDAVLKGGFLNGSAVILCAPPSADVFGLLRGFLSASEPDARSLFISRGVSIRDDLQEDLAHTTFLVCGERVPSSGNVLAGKGLENLTELSLDISEAVNKFQPKRVVIDVTSDLLLRHGPLQTRKWLSDQVSRLKSKAILTLALVNPSMHTQTEVSAVADLFDGMLEISERELNGQPTNFLFVKWMHGITVTETEPIPLDLANQSSRTSSELGKVKAEQSGSIKELDQKLDTIMSRLATIEQVLSESLEHPELASTISGLRAGVLLVKEPITALERLSTASKYVRRRSVEKDEISRLIIQTLALKGPQNTSQIERAIREARGHASRRIIRSRIQNLIQEGILRPGKGRGASYELIR